VLRNIRSRPTTNTRANWLIRVGRRLRRMTCKLLQDTLQKRLTSIGWWILLGRQRRDERCA
jgi:hypothetical protein